MDDFNKIKSRIKKLLALSRSPNPSEAASALKMAQALMEKYRIARADINTFDIGEEIASTAFRHDPPRYEAVLISQISSAFDCKNLYHIKAGTCVWHFIGLRHRAEVAAYIGQVLLRKLKSARADYTKSLCRVRSKYRKTQRADDFCKGWVAVVTDKLPAFAGMSVEEKKALELYMNNNHQNLKGFNAINRSFGHDADFFNGARAGKGVRLQRGVGGSFSNSLLPGA